MPVACRKGIFRGQLVAHREVPGSPKVTKSFLAHQNKTIPSGVVLFWLFTQKTKVI